MGGRVYDPRLGRFLSPDPIIGNPGSSQSWNLYSYAGNSPMSFTDPTGLVRSSLPWENNACGPAQGCLNLNSGAGGFGATTQRIDSYRPHIFAGIVTFLFPSWASGWGVEGGWSHGYSVRTVGYLFARRTQTSRTVSVSGDRQPGDKPVNEVDGKGTSARAERSTNDAATVAPNQQLSDEEDPSRMLEEQGSSVECPPVELQCRAVDTGGVGYGTVSTFLGRFLGGAPSKRTKWGRYECTGKGGQCSFVGPGSGTNLYGVKEFQVWQFRHGELSPYPVQMIKSFEVNPESRWDRLKYGPEFFEALNSNLQDCKLAGLCE